MNEKFIDELSKYLAKEICGSANSDIWYDLVKKLLTEYSKQGYSSCEDCERIDPDYVERIQLGL